MSDVDLLALAFLQSFLHSINDYFFQSLPARYTHGFQKQTTHQMIKQTTHHAFKQTTHTHHMIKQTTHHMIKQKLILEHADSFIIFVLVKGGVMTEWLMRLLPVLDVNGSNPSCE